MAENESNKLPSPLPLISSIAIISAAILIWHSQLESPRPSPPSGLEPAVLDAGAVDAALWQDPFEVALSHEREFHRGAKDSALTRLRSCSSDHCANLMGDGINQRIQDSAVWKDALAAQAADRNGPPWATAAQKDVRPARAADPNDPPAAVHILMVMVRDEWSAEDHERGLGNEAGGYETHSVLEAVADGVEMVP
jgi:hypothetical protein